MLPPGGYMAKVDLKSAYRSVPIHPKCYPATGLQWTFTNDTKPTFFYDTRLPFGASMSPEIFQRLASSVTRMMKNRGYQVIAYLDDFLIIEGTKNKCKAAFDTLIRLLQDLGFTINWDKVTPPAKAFVMN